MAEPSIRQALARLTRRARLARQTPSFKVLIAYLDAMVMYVIANLAMLQHRIEVLEGAAGLPVPARRRGGTPDGGRKAGTRGHRAKPSVKRLRGRRRTS